MSVKKKKNYSTTSWHIHSCDPKIIRDIIYIYIYSRTYHLYIFDYKAFDKFGIVHFLHRENLINYRVCTVQQLCLINLIIFHTRHASYVCEAYERQIQLSTNRRIINRLGDQGRHGLYIYTQRLLLPSQLRLVSKPSARA